MTAPELTTEQLIVLGRDREAVAAALRGPTRGTGPDMDGVAQLDEIIPMLEGIVLRIPAAGYDAATPCSEWTVTGVLEHMTAGATTFAAAFSGSAPPASSAGKLREQWGSAMRGLLDAVHSPGSQERTIASPFGDVPGADFARFVALDGLVHGWDLCSASGQAYVPREELVLAVDGFARQALTPAIRASGAFRDPVEPAPGADALGRLVAFTGRRAP